MAYTRKEILEYCNNIARMCQASSRREQPISNHKSLRDADYGYGRREEPSTHYLRKSSSLY
jgi:hypothetical protein